MRRFVFLGIILLGSQILNSQDSLKILKSIAFNGLDGPYIFDETQYHVNDKNKLIVDSYTKGDTLIVQVDNSYSDSFQLTLESEYKPSESSYDLPAKMIILSDIEGKFNAFSSFLIANKVIDDNHNWIYDDGHLVLLGDFVDRGKNVTQVLWLIYKLEHQALKHGGRVHYILGNHEILNFHGDHRYNRGKYIKLAQ